MRLCECGCGESTPLAAQTDRKRGYVKGQPHRFVKNHGSRRLAAEYVVEDRGFETPCWIWQRFKQKGNGYGVRSRNGRLVLAHRDAWEQRHGEIPEGLEIDHRCRVKSCVNPDHLRLATHPENGQNRGLEGNGGASGRRGVTWDDGWTGRVMVAGRMHYLGQFATVDEADAACRAFRREHMPFSEADQVA